VFQQNEKLDRNNTWYCSTCKAHKEAWKMMQIYTLPTVLIIQLKRFRNQGGFRNKISVPVSFPLSALDMSQFVISHGAWMYDLFAVVNHHGDLGERAFVCLFVCLNVLKTGGGHYTAYAKQNITKQWYLMIHGSLSLKMSPLLFLQQLIFSSISRERRRIYNWTLFAKIKRETKTNFVYVDL
jgi:ubiquitin carboxyl-terminal hydrolase 4/11/15